MYLVLQHCVCSVKLLSLSLQLLDSNSSMGPVNSMGHYIIAKAVHVYISIGCDYSCKNLITDGARSLAAEEDQQF